MSNTISYKVKKLKLNYGLLKYHFANTLNYHFTDPLRLLPRYIFFKTTYRCNLICRMCSLQSGPDASLPEMSFEQTRGLFERLRQSYQKQKYLPHLTISGGEPFIREDLTDLLELVDRLGITAEVLTNGTLIQRQDARRLSRLKRFSLQVSLDGLPEVHDAIRSMKGAFEKTVENIRRLLDLGLPPDRIQIACTVSSLNQDSLVPFVEYLGGLGWGIKLQMHFLQFVNKSALESFSRETVQALGAKNVSLRFYETSLNNVDCALLFQQLRRVKNAAAQNKIPLMIKPSMSKDEMQSYFYNNNYVSPVKRCTALSRSIKVCPDGSVYPCLLGYRLGDLNKASIESIYFSEEAINFRKKVRKQLFSSCHRCCFLIPPSFYS